METQGTEGLTQSPASFNPFPGLRPFEPDEDHLFFGREKQIDELLRRLRSTRFLSVIGTSGSGKSSLVRSGLIPALQGGFMAKAGSSWRVSVIRPGEDPIRNLAMSLNASDVLGTTGDLVNTSQVLLEVTLRRSTLGLIEAVRQAMIPPEENLLLVIDQFEELFRFRRSRQAINSRDEAVAFVKLLLEATEREDAPIYVVLTMRSDFIGDCVDFPGLPEAVNAGLYLVPRMTRDELRSAITGPVAVGGGEITPRLVSRLLNDLGDDADRLPLLQHVLMRTWEHWQRHRQSGKPIDITDYEAVGTLREALSLHVEEAYQETGTGRSCQVAQLLFKALTDTFSDQRGVRRPTSIRELAAICEASAPEVIQIVEVFRRPGRCFLMPPYPAPLDSRSIIDLSHESLMRCWPRLIGWAEEERVSASYYIRLSQASAWFEEGAAGLWRDPELELGLQWRRDNQPTAAWAQRYDSSFTRAIEFLNRSKNERDRIAAEREKERKRKLRQAQWAVAVLGTLLVITGVAAVLARIEKKRADMNQIRADRNFLLTEGAMNSMLAVAGTEPGRVAEDVPQLEQLRRQLAQKVEDLYLDLTKQKPDSEGLREEMAVGYVGLGDSNRLLNHNADAVKDYKLAIAQFESLARDSAGTPKYRQETANSYDSLGLALMMQQNASSDAANAFGNALQIQQDLVRDSPGNAQYQQELARTYYNRGILRYGSGKPAESDSDFHQAIQLLEALAQQSTGLGPSQELARAYNDLGNVLKDEMKLPEARSLFERAIDIDRSLITKEPLNRDYKLELASFDENLALLLYDQGDFDRAEQKNRQALDLLGELATPAPSLALTEANGHNIRGLILESQRSLEAEKENRESMEILEKLKKVQDPHDLPDFHRVLRDLGYNYLELANNNLKSGQLPDAQRDLQNLSRLLPDVSDEDRVALTKYYQELLHKIATHN